MNIPSFLQIWIAFKTFSSKSILKVGYGFKFFLSLAASLYLAYVLYICYDIPIRDVQIYVHKLYGLCSKDDIELNLNMDYGGDLTSRYKKNYKTGITLKTSNPYVWDHKDTTIFCASDRVLYAQGEHILRRIDYPLLDILRSMKKLLPSDTSQIYSLYAVHIIESQMPRYNYKNYYGIEENRSIVNAIYQRDSMRSDSIVRYEKASKFEMKEELDSVSKLESVTATGYFCKSDPNAAAEVLLPTTKSITKLRFLDPFDISQCYYHLTLDIPQGGKGSELVIDFGGATDFSEMYPEPDKKTMSSIVYSDSLKIRRIGLDGLWMHAKFTHLENLQIIRIFVITTALGFFVALLFSTGWNWLALRSRRYIRKMKKPGNSLEE